MRRYSEKRRKRDIGVFQFVSFILPPTPTLYPRHTCPSLTPVVLRPHCRPNGGCGKGAMRRGARAATSTGPCATVHTFCPGPSRQGTHSGQAACRHVSLATSELGLTSHTSPESSSLLPSYVVADIRFHRGQEVSLEFLRHIK